MAGEESAPQSAETQAPAARHLFFSWGGEAGRPPMGCWSKGGDISIPRCFILNIHVHGGSSQALTGEIGLSEFQNVFAEVSIYPETMELLQKSLRETHFEATATCFEYSMES